jgi:glutaryl-CoA dehydrogenase
MQKMELIGAFGLTEPEVGSGVAGGLTCTCKRKGDIWTLNGQKKWIGNATFADLTVIWARDLDDGNVKGFVVEKDNPGFKAEKIKGKMALRIVQNALITLTDCEVSESNRLQNANSFKDTAKVLRMTRAGVAWQAVGCARGAYESALRYTNERKQFGRTISSFQMVQDLLVMMLSNLTAMQTMVCRLSQLQDNGKLTDEQASLAKVFCTLRTRDIVSHARELFGGNGILIDYDIARFVADAEAIYSYEGTKKSIHSSLDVPLQDRAHLFNFSVIVCSHGARRIHKSVQSTFSTLQYFKNRAEFFLIDVLQLRITFRVYSTMPLELCLQKGSYY